MLKHRIVIHRHGELLGHFDACARMTRQAVTQHLQLLEDANLVAVAPDELDRLLALYASARGAGDSHEQWVRQALTAVLALGLGWHLLQQDQSYYQISQSNEPYPVQVHQLIPQQPEKLPVEQYNVQSGQRQALYTQEYQAYLKASKNSQIQRQLIVSRQLSDDGWHLDVCQQMQLQLTSEWLAQFKRQQHWTEPQWQQLQQSDWLQVTTGAQGQILALQRSEQPPACAP